MRCIHVVGRNRISFVKTDSTEHILFVDELSTPIINPCVINQMTNTWSRPLMNNVRKQLYFIQKRQMIQRCKYRISMDDLIKELESSYRGH
jgi:hypothetical protein